MATIFHGQLTRYVYMLIINFKFYNIFYELKTRTWQYALGTQLHIINLYHDTITGVRSAMLNHEEINGSLGMSTIAMNSTAGHRILFGIAGG